MVKGHTQEAPFINIITLANELWHERKGYDFERGYIGEKRSIARMEKKIAQLDSIKEMLLQEIEILKSLSEESKKRSTPKS